MSILHDNDGSQTAKADDFESHLKAAHLLRDMSGGRLIYVPNLGWHGWDGTRWVQDEYAAQRSLYELALRVRASDNDTYKLLNNGKNTSIVSKLAEPLLERPVHDLDADTHLLNTPNGVLDLTDGSVSPHDPKYLMTKITRGSYNPNCNKSVTRKFLGEVLPDNDTRRYVCQLFGLALFGSVRERVAPMFYGGGYNGKTTLLEAQLYAFGSYGVKLDTEVITAGKTHDEKILQLRGARLAIVSETEVGARLNTAFIKKSASNESMTAKPLYKKPVSWKVSHTMIHDTNHKPRVNGTDRAIFDRIRIIEFTEDFRDRLDQELGDKLAGEADALITWAVAGWLDYQANGLQEPVSVLAATQGYQGESDTVGRWLADRTDRCGEHTGRTQLHQDYRFYCMGESIEDSDVLKAADFYVALERAGYRAAMVHGTRGFKGIKIVYPASVG